MATRLDVDKITSPFADEETHGAEYFRQLRTRLQWQFLIAFIVPLLLLSVFFYIEYETIYQKGVESHLRSVAENKRNTVSMFLQERVANVKSAFSFQGLPQPPTSGKMKEILDEMRKESTAFVDLGLFNSQGALVAYTGPFPSLLGRVYHKEDWYQRLHQRKEAYYISDVYLGFRQKPHFIIAVRRELNGQDWTLRASVDPKRFSEIVGRSILLKGGEAFIINRDGKLQTMRGGKRFPPEISRVPAPGIDTQVNEIEWQEHKFLAAFAWIVETDWALVVQVPRVITNAPMGRARQNLAIFFIATLILLVLLVVRGTRKIVGRLESADRTKEDLRQQLFNAAKLASVGEMAAGVAHEINNPLAIIYEEAGLLKDSLDPQFRQEFDISTLEESLEAIMAATLRGRAITSNMLAFARRYNADPELINVNDFVEKVLEIKKNEFATSNLKVCKTLDPELPHVLANYNQMEQVMLNLLNNARDAINGPGRIGIKTRRREGEIQIDVEDTGCGMTSEQLQKVFFPFYTTKGVGKGTGLGLSISYGIIKALGGRLEVASEPGVGSTFTIFLPLTRASHEEGVHP